MKHSLQFPTVAATLAAALTLAACVSPNNAELARSHPQRIVQTSEGSLGAPNAIPAGATDLAWNDAGLVRLARMANSGFRDPARLVIDDDAQWATAWTLLWAGNASKAAPPRPAIDFTRNTVIVAALGQGSAHGLGIELARVATTSDVVYAEVSSMLSVGCASRAQLSQPVDVIRVPKPHAPIVFIERSADGEC